MALMDIAKAFALVIVCLLAFNWLGGSQMLSGVLATVTQRYFVAFLLVITGIYGLVKSVDTKIDAQDYLYGGILAAGFVFMFFGNLLPFLTFGFNIPSEITLDAAQIINGIVAVVIGLVAWQAVKKKI